MTNPASEPLHRQAQEAYPCAGSRAVPRYIATRTAEKQAAFLLPHLRPGMELLDCGCGPGSITVGLARYVAPGRVVGIDINPSQIELAQTSAADQSVSNLRFETADIYRLPFPDGAFDAVFSTSVLMYLSDPVAALREIQRVLKPGGVVGIRDPDHEAQLCAPPDPLLKRFWQLLDALIQRKGGNPNIGKHQRALLRQAGFTNILANASCECWSTTEATRQWADVLASMFREDTYIQQFVELDLAEPAELAEISQAWREWSEHPDAFFVDVFCETLGWKA
jgi:ubiquinone/menaquinone biosynthesis C-methylase UbiE